MALAVRTPIKATAGAASPAIAAVPGATQWSAGITVTAIAGVAAVAAVTVIRSAARPGATGSGSSGAVGIIVTGACASGGAGVAKIITITAAAPTAWTARRAIASGSRLRHRKTCVCREHSPYIK